MFPMQSGQPDDRIYVDDVFVSYTRTGTGASQVTTTNIDMTNGYMLWSKGRSAATDHALYHSARGVTLDLVSNSTAAQTTEATGLTAVSSTGHTYGALAKVNTSAATYVDWVLRNAANFYHHDVIVKSAGSNATYNFSTITTLGMVRVKRTDAAGSWHVWHRSLTAGNLLIGETTAAEATLGHITVSGNTVTLVNGVIADGTYLVEAFAHDTGVDGIIQCGSFTTDAGGNFSVTTGVEPQFLLVKATNEVQGWAVVDTARGYVATVGRTTYLLANSSAADSGPSITYAPNATGFTGIGTASRTFVYMTIRRPNKPPTSGTQVFNTSLWSGADGTGNRIITTGSVTPDAFFIQPNRTGASNEFWYDRLRGGSQYIQPGTAGAEAPLDGVRFDRMLSIALGTGNFDIAPQSYVGWAFRRAPGVFDEICYSGTGTNKTEAHNLTKAPELWLVKGRSGATEWVWGSSLLAATEKIVMPTPAGKVTDATAWNSTYPTVSVVSLGTAAAVNASAATYTMYLWATLAGISKVFGYTGDGASGKVINCGFAAGARFVLIIRTDAAGDIFIWDSVRGIVAANDPHLSLNTTAAEVTTDDSIDPDNSGFIVNQVAATNINVNGATYIGVAYS